MEQKFIMYKFVRKEEDGSWTSHGGMKWEIGKTNVATGPGKRLCTSGLLHCYASPEQAVLFFSRHLEGEIKEYVLLEIATSEIAARDGLKFGMKEQTPIRIVSTPVLTTEQRVYFAVLCALEVFKGNSVFETWASNWISGENRTRNAANAAAYAAANAAYAAADAAAYAANAKYIDFQSIINEVLTGATV